MFTGNGPIFHVNISLSWTGLPTDLCPDSKFLTRSLELTDYVQNCTNILTDLAIGPGCKFDFDFNVCLKCCKFTDHFLGKSTPNGGNIGGFHNWNCVKWWVNTTSVTTS